MLVDIDTNYGQSFERLRKGIYKQLDFLGPYQHLGRENGWEDNFLLWPEFQSAADVDARLKALQDMCKSETFFSTYGSCDSPKQFMATDTARIIEASPMNLLITFRHMTKADYPDYRWHKNGSYFGKKRREYECLGDEKHIHAIYQFAVYRKL